VLITCTWELCPSATAAGFTSIRTYKRHLFEILDCRTKRTNQT
jgi:hypothetical protein